MNIENLSPAEARRYVINYYRDGNTMGISDSDMGKIVRHFGKDKVQSWCADISKDHNQYEVTDDKWDNYTDAGREQAEDLTGYQNNFFDRADQTMRPYAAQLVNSRNSFGTTAKIGEKAGERLFSKAIDKGKKAGEKAANAVTEAAGKAGEKAATEAAEKASEETAAKFSEGAIGAAGAILTGTIELAQGTLSVAKPANKEQVDAANAAGEQMPEMMQESSDAGSLSYEMAEQSQEDADYVSENVEETNTGFEEGMADYALLEREVKLFEKMKTQGHNFTTDEIKKYQETLAKMEKMKVDNDETTEKVSEEIEEIYSEVEDREGEFENAAETMGNVQGFTDELAEYDEKTVSLCNTEATALGVSVATDGIDAAKAIATGIDYCNPYTAAIAAMYFAGAAMSATGAVTSGIGAGKQTQFAGQVTQDVALRQQTQGINEGSISTYSESIDVYEATRSEIADNEIVTPEIETPEAIELTPANPGEEGDGNGKRRRPDNNNQA